MKRSSLAAFCLLLFIVLPGCTSSRNAEEGDVLTVWHWMSDRQEAFRTLSKRYEELTGQTVRFELYAPSDAYAQKVKASAQTQTLPDIFGVLGESRDIASFIKSGYIADLSQIPLGSAEALWREELFDQAVSVNTFKAGNDFGIPPGVYGVPLDITTVQMMYNKKLFRKAGLDPERPPVTWEEFLACAAKLKEQKIPVLVSGFGETWMIEALATSFAINAMGEDKFFDTYRGKVPYTDPDWLRVFALFETMAERGIVIPSAVTMVNKSAEQVFANEHAAFSFGGAWSVNVYLGMNPELEYGALLPPRVSNVNPVKVWGGAGSSLMVNAKSRRREDAYRFLVWLVQKDQQIYFSQATHNVPAHREAVKTLPGIVSEFADDIDNTVHPNQYPAHEDPRVLEVWLKGIQSILIGEASGIQIAEKAEATKARLKASR